MIAQASSSRATTARFLLAASLVCLLAAVGESSFAGKPRPDGSAAALRHPREASADEASDATTPSSLAVATAAAAAAADDSPTEGAADGLSEAAVESGSGEGAEARGAHRAAGGGGGEAATGDSAPAAAAPTGVSQQDGASAAAAAAAEHDAAQAVASAADSVQPVQGDATVGGGDAKTPDDGSDSGATNGGDGEAPPDLAPPDPVAHPSTPAAAVIYVQPPPVLSNEETPADGGQSKPTPVVKTVFYSKTFDKENRCLYCNGELCRGIDRRTPSVCYSIGPCWVSKTFETYAEFVRVNNQSLGCTPTLTPPVGFDCRAGTATACTLTGSTCLCCCNGDTCNGADYCDKLLAMSSASRECCPGVRSACWSFVAATVAAALASFT